MSRSTGDLGLWLSKQRPLVSVEDIHPSLVDRGPIILQNASCISRVGIPAPVGVADAVVAEVAHKRRLPGSLGTLVHRAAKFAEIDRCNVLCLEITPMGLPDAGHILGE